MSIGYYEATIPGMFALPLPRPAQRLQGTETIESEEESRMKCLVKITLCGSVQDGI
jgi:hypothetical protein